MIFPRGGGDCFRARHHLNSRHRILMASIEKTSIYAAIMDPQECSRIEDQLVLDGVDVSCFGSARELWEHYEQRPVRFVITDRRFDRQFDGLELVRRIRKHHQLPYGYILMRSRMAQLKEIRQGLEAGVDDYLIFPHNSFQIRSRVLVGLRWLTYIDSLTWKETAAKA